MSNEHAGRQPLGSAKVRPQWRPLDSLRTSMVKQVFSRDHFTHKKGLLFTPMVHADESVPKDPDAANSSAPLDATEDAVHSDAAATQTEPTETPLDAERIEDIRAQAFAEGLAQGLEQAQAQAEQAQAQSDQEQVAAQTTAQTQALLQEIDAKVDALTEDPAQLQEPLKRLALHLAEQLVLGELTVSPQAVEHVIERCMDTLDAADTSTVVVELNPQDLALLQNQQRADDQPKPAWRMQADHLLLPGSVRVRADDAVVSDLIEHRLESLAHSLLKDPKAWQAQSAFAPSKLASRLASQRGSAHTVEDAQAKPQGMKTAMASEPMAEYIAEPVHEAMTEAAASPAETFEPTDFDDAEATHSDTDFGTDFDTGDAAEKHTYEAHEVMRATAPPPEAATKNFADALTDISLELDKLDD